MTRALLILTVFLASLLYSQSSIAAKRWVTFKIDNATITVKGNEKYINSFREAYDVSEEKALNFLLDTKCSIGRKCRIKDQGEDGSKFTGNGSVRLVTETWQEWKALSES